MFDNRRIDQPKPLEGVVTQTIHPIRRQAVDKPKVSTSSMDGVLFFKFKITLEYPTVFDRLSNPYLLTLSMMAIFTRSDYVLYYSHVTRNCAVVLL